MNKADLVRPEVFTTLFRRLCDEYPALAEETVLFLAWSETDHGVKVTGTLRGLALDLLIPERIIPVVVSSAQLASLITDQAEWRQFFLQASGEQQPYVDGRKHMVFRGRKANTHG